MNISLFELGKASVETKVTGHGMGDSPLNIKNENQA
jgi:hypothetical protein